MPDGCSSGVMTDLVPEDAHILAAYPTVHLSKIWLLTAGFMTKSVENKIAGRLSFSAQAGEW